MVGMRMLPNHLRWFVGCSPGFDGWTLLSSTASVKAGVSSVPYNTVK
jgi:hypothetical protein